MMRIGKVFPVTCLYAPREGRGVIVPYLNFGVRLGWVSKATPRLDDARETDMLPTVQVAGWASGRVAKVQKNLNLTGIRTPVRMAQEN